METSEVKIGCIVVFAFIVVGVGIAWLQAANESATYNRLTGAHTTAWDALWVELRVQGTTGGK